MSVGLVIYHRDDVMRWVETKPETLLKLMKRNVPGSQYYREWKQAQDAKEDETPMPEAAE